MLGIKTQVSARCVATPPRWLLRMASQVHPNQPSHRSSQQDFCQDDPQKVATQGDESWKALNKLLKANKKRLPGGCSWDVLDDEEKSILVANKLVNKATLHLTDRDRLESYGISAGAAAILKHVFPDSSRTATAVSKVSVEAPEGASSKKTQKTHKLEEQGQNSGTTGSMAKQRRSRVHPQQGHVNPRDLPIGKWYDLDVTAPFPEPNLRIYCSGCGDKNRTDEGWRYCRDPAHAAIQRSATIFLGPYMRNIGFSEFATFAMLKYQCKSCRRTKRAAKKSTM